MTEVVARRSARKFATVAFADLVGSTELAQCIDAESFHLLQARWFEAMSEVIKRHGGSVEKFIGDAVVAVFGVPTGHEDDPLRAVRAAVEMRDALAALNRDLRADSVPLRMRTTVNTGEVFSSDISLGYSFAAGEPMNVTARLQLFAGPDEILLGDGTRRLVGSAVTVEALEPLSLKGIDEAVIAHRLLALHENALVGRGQSVPLVGRRREIDRLRLAFREVMDSGCCKMVTLTGPAGIGKSRLIEELVGELGDEATVVTGQCLSYGDDITYWPLVEVVRQATGSPGSAPQEWVAGLDTLLAGEERGEQVASAVAGLVGHAQTAAVPGPQELAWALRRFFDALARRGPLVVVIEDVHWAGPGLLDLLEQVASTMHGPMLLLCSGRPEFGEQRPRWVNGEQGSAITLAALNTGESKEVLAHLLDGRPMPSALQTRVAATAGGNPLFLAEITRMLVAEQWLGTDDRVDVPLPASLNVLLTASLDRLSPGEREVLDCAAVVGERFTVAAVAALGVVGSLGGQGLADQLRALARRQLVAPDPTSVGPDAFRFAHALIRDAAYAGIPKLRRAQLHERLAQWLETQIEGWAIEDAVIGFHLEQAYRHRVAVLPAGEREQELALRGGRRLAAAGHQAFLREDGQSAISLLRRAAELLPVDDAVRVAVLPDLAHTLVEHGRLEEADALLTDEFAVGRDALPPEARALARMVHARVRVLLERGTVDEMRAAADDGMPLLRRSGDHHGQALAAYTRAWVAFALGRSAEAQVHQEQAMEHERVAGSTQRALGFLSSLSQLKVRGPTPASAALRWCEARIPEVHGHLLAEARLTSATGALRAMLGDVASARRLVAQSRSLFDELAIPYSSDTVSRMLWGEVCLLNGDPAGAEREYRQVCEAMEAIGERYQLSTSAALLALVLAELRRYDEAETYADMSQRATAIDDVLAQSQWRQARSVLYAASGQAADAVMLATEAVEVIRPTEFLVAHADAVLCLAQVLVSVGRLDDALPVFDQAAGLYRSKENLVRARQAESALGDLVAR